MVEHDLVLLAQQDEKQDSAGNVITLHRRLRVSIYDDDVDDAGKEDNLIAEGTVEKIPLAGGRAPQSGAAE